MPFVAISRCVKFELIYEWGDVGKVLANVLHFQAQTFNVYYTAQITSDNCNTWMTSWGDNVMSLLGEVLQLTKVIATDLGSEGGVQAESTESAIAGSGGSNPLPSSVAACISLYTPTRGRSYRGRVFVPGLQIGNLDGNGLMQDDITEALVAGVNAFNTSIGADGATGFQLAVASRKLATATQVTNVTCNRQTASSQDRREVGLS